MTHFTEAYDNLRDTENLTIEDYPSFNQANLAEAILNTIQLAQKEHPISNINKGQWTKYPTYNFHIRSVSESTT